MIALILLLIILMLIKLGMDLEVALKASQEWDWTPRRWKKPAKNFSGLKIICILFLEMEATARTLLESYCPAYLSFWDNAIYNMIATMDYTSQFKDHHKTLIICEIMNPSPLGHILFRTAYMRKRCLVLASVAFPELFTRFMSERYAEFCTEEYKAKALLEVQNLHLKAEIKAKKEEVKKLLAEHKKTVRMMKKRGVPTE